MPSNPGERNNARRAIDWQSVLTPDERETVLAADAAKAKWEALMPQRAFIVNRAIQRAKYRLGLR